jgi:hypothetical protein
MSTAARLLDTDEVAVYFRLYLLLYADDTVILGVRIIAPTARYSDYFFSSLLFSGSFVQCAQLFLQFLTFPITGRSITIALSGGCTA